MTLTKSDPWARILRAGYRVQPRRVQVTHPDGRQDSAMAYLVEKRRPVAAVSRTRATWEELERHPTREAAELRAGELAGVRL